MLLCAVFCISSGIVSLAWSQTKLSPGIRKPSFFIGGSYFENYSAANILAFDGIDQCGIFRGGNKTAPSIFAGVAFPLWPRFSLDTRLEYDNLSTVSNINVNETPSTPLAWSHGIYVPITRSRSYNATLSLTAISGLISYDLLPNVQLAVGPFVGVLAQHRYLETEQIVSPDSAVYVENSLPNRTISSGSIPNVNLLQFGLELNIGYELQAEPNIGLRPSFGMMLPFTNISPNGGFHLYPITASLELVYHVPEAALPEEDVPIAVEEPQTIPPPHAPSPVEEPHREVLQVSIKALGIEENGKEVSEPVLSIERTHVTEVYPMLHYVFFNDGTATIPARYDLSTPETRSQFSEKSLYKDDALQIHHHVLDIIGQRLVENPSASITLIGARSEHSPGDSAAGPSIAMDRARTIENYLTTVWGIAPDRIRLRARGLPEAPSDDHNPSGEAENRRVEIIPSTPDITAPLWTEHIERVATPPRIDFVPTITTAERVGIRSAKITVLQDGHLLRSIDALSDSSVSNYRWTIDDRSMPRNDASREDSLTYLFTAIDSLGDTARATGVIHIHEQVSDIQKHAADTSFENQIERYSLILFDYSSSQLDKTESQIVVRDMSSAIHDSTQVTLTGHTDQTGDEAFNEQLSRERAMQAAQMLRQQLRTMGKPEPNITVEWRGGRDELFDNSIPEGRVLSRTVRAVIENPE